MSFRMYCLLPLISVAVLVELERPLALADENVCPAQMSNVKKSGSFNFGYQSWSWPEGNHFAYCDCVRNYGSRPMFVSWRKAGLTGWPAAGNVLFSYATSSVGTSKEIPAPLWYGFQPTVIEDAKIVRPSDEVAVTRSSGAVGFPDLTEIPEKVSNSPAALADYIEENPDSIVTIQMSFESKVTIDADTGKVNSIINNCKYKLVSSKSGEPTSATIYSKFDDPQLQRMMFKTDEPVRIEDARRSLREFQSGPGRWQPGSDGNLQMTGWQPTTPTEAASLINKEANFLLTGRSGTPVFASIPVHFLAGPSQ